MQCLLLLFAKEGLQILYTCYIYIYITSNQLQMWVRFVTMTNKKLMHVNDQDIERHSLSSPVLSPYRRLIGLVGS